MGWEFKLEGRMEKRNWLLLAGLGLSACSSQLVLCTWWSQLGSPGSSWLFGVLLDVLSELIMSVFAKLHHRVHSCVHLGLLVCVHKGVLGVCSYSQTVHCVYNCCALCVFTTAVHYVCLQLQSYSYVWKCSWLLCPEAVPDHVHSSVPGCS